MVTGPCALARLLKSVPMLELLVAGRPTTLTALCGSQSFRPDWALGYSATHIPTFGICSPYSGSRYVSSESI